jgi:eukaryotic-like serine/threonine-protein kinase
MGNPHGATWNARGEIIFANVDGPLQRIAAGGCSSSPLTRLDGSRGQVSHIRPQLLPDGRHVIYTSVGKSTEARIVSLDDPNDDVPLGIGGVAMYSAGHLVFNTRGRLLAQAFDLDTRRLTGEPVTLVPRVAEGIGRHLTQFSVSASGVVSYGTYVPAHSRLTWFDRHGNPLGTVGDVGEYGSLSLSPDESRLAVAKVNENSTEASVWVIELPGGSRRITRGGHDWLPVWSAGGQRIVFSSERDQSYSVLMQAPSDGSTEPEVLLEPGIWNWLNDWSRDGEFVVYAADSKDTAGDLWILPLTGDRTPWRFLKTPDFEGGAAFSPDGNWIAYVSVESGRPEIHVRAFPSASKLRQVSTNGGLNPVWRKDGRELFFGAPDQWLMAATLSGNHVSEVKKLFQLPSAVGLWHQYTVTGDGSRILAIVPEPQAIARTISVIVNWPSLLNQK